MELRRGIAVCPGIAIGPALVLDNEGVWIKNKTVPTNMIDAEVGRLSTAVFEARIHADDKQKDITAKFGRDIGAIFEAKGGFFEDRKLINGIITLIRSDEYSAEYAVSRHVREILKKLDAAANLPQAARMRGDYIDFERELLLILNGQQREPLNKSTTDPVIVLANDLTPNETAEFDADVVLGLATETGGATSHTAILANALDLPAVVGVGRFLTEVSGGDIVIIDGNTGLVILDPDPPTLERYRKLQASLLTTSGQHTVFSKHARAETKDGVHIALLGNIEFPSEVKQCLDKGAEGVGLYRTEFLYVQKVSDPTEEEHYLAYKRVLQDMGPDRPVVIRTLDLGGDKYHPANMGPTHEKNPFLGLRSIRLCLRNLPLFKTQLRAILRASVYGQARIMFPMISTTLELRQCLSHLREVQEDLDEAKIPYKPNIPLGTMIEVPSAALMADKLASLVDFFSIGTNDLVQYTLAADRNNENVADLYSAADPSVLRLMEMVTRAGHVAGIDVNVCGEMSGETLYTPLLVGLGVRQFSATPRKIPEIKRVVRSLTVSECKAVARECLQMETASEVSRYLRDTLRRIIPDAVD